MERCVEVQNHLVHDVAGGPHLEAVYGVGSRVDPDPEPRGKLWAYETDHGISDVELQIDDGPWRAASVAPWATAETWSQWTYDWNAGPGPHILRVRATDGNGELQTDMAGGAFPDGATGLHAVTVEVRP